MAIMRILLVEDEMSLAEALVYILKKNGYIVDHTDDGTYGHDMAETDIYDVLILDRMLPGMEGVEILKSLRVKGIQTPAIFLTARDAISNRIEGLDAGADDYLIKPFAKDELLARVRALGRRSHKPLSEDILKLAFLELNVNSCEVIIKTEVINLSVKESHLLEYLIRNKGQTLTKEQLLDKIWGFENDVEISIVELYIFYLRKKINFEHAGIEIKTVRGIGYCLKEIG